MTGSWLDAHARELIAALDTLRAQGDRIDRWAATLGDALDAGGRLLVAGNGGSAAEAQHLTAELVGRFEGERQPRSALCLSAETSTLTALVNDYGAEEMFARQVQAHGRPGDVLVLLSTSGRSPNVLRAAERGHTGGLTVWALTGPAPNPLADLADDALCVPTPTTAGVQALHLVAIHALCAAVDERRRTVADGQPVDRQPVDGQPVDGPRIVVVGDLVLDRDVTGTADRLCPDSPAPVVDVATVRESPGGAGMAALLCAASGARVTLVAPVAQDEAGRRLVELLAPDVSVLPLPHVGPTRTKTRVRAGGQSLVRLDAGGPGRPGAVPEDEVRAALADADAVLVSDYGGGCTRDERLRTLLAGAVRSTRTVWDPHPRGGTPLPGSTLVTPNLAEARGALRAVGTPDPAASPDPGTVDPGTADPPDLLAGALRDAWHARGVAVTAGERGAYLAAAGDTVFVPAPSAPPGDSCGAGDRFAASATVALARGAVLSRAVVGAVEDASAWVAGDGATGFHERRATASGTARSGAGSTGPVTGVPEADHDPGALAARLRLRGGTLVATGGCFDLVHAGHVATLQAARRLGDALVVLLNSDDSVRRLKGPGRPLVGAADRARVLEALDCVDAVVVFDGDDPRAALERLRPDLWVKGGDYGGTRLPEADVVEGHGGRVVLLPYLDGRSTSSLIQRTGAARARTPSRSTP